MSIARREFLLAGGSLAASGFGRGPRASRQPNIVYILADDVGCGDFSCYNAESKLQTPAVDRLASQGMRFTDAHSGSALCSPTRYGLLTGRYAWRTRLQMGVLMPYDPPLIEAGRLTVPALLKQHGYQTACIGKWHLGWDWPKRGQDPDFTEPIANGPITRGFDYYFGTDVPNFPPYCFIENDRTVGQPTSRKTEQNLDGRPGPMAPGWKFEDILPTLVDRAKGYIRKQASGGQPFFLYFPLTTPHEPLHPSARFLGKSGINAVADLLLETDWAVSEILQQLDQEKLSDNTLVVFAGDNGHSAYTGLPELLAAGHRPSGPWKGYKGNVYEGGHRIPFVARWPGRIRPRSTCDQTICLGDFLATTASILKTRLPDNAGEDSYDILSALTGTAKRPIRDYTVHHGGLGQFAIRQGPWKFIPAWQPPANIKSQPNADLLFNLSEDPGETRNMAGEHPQIVAKLAALLARCKSDGRSRSLA